MNEEEFMQQMLAGVEADEEIVTETGLVDEEPNADSTEATDGAPTETTTTVDSDETPTQKDDGKPSKKVDLNFEETFEKSNKAFAEQRLRLKQQEELLMKFAAASNMKVSNPEEAFEKLSGILTAKEAESKNIDPLLLRKMQMQDELIAKYEQEEIRKEANASFAKLQESFNLSQKDIESFAKQLSSNGINPFATKGINLDQHYISMNFQKLIERAEERGVQKEIERQKRVAKSTQPTQAVGENTSRVADDSLKLTGNSEVDFFTLFGNTSK